eukprot:217653_1
MMKLDVCVLALFVGVAYGQISLGSFAPGAMYGISGSLVAVDEHTIRIDDFSYNGAGPGVLFWVSTGAISQGRVVTGSVVGRPDNCISAGKINAYNRETVFIELEEDTPVADLQLFSIWCELFGASFATVNFAAIERTGLPTARASNFCGHQGMADLPNCEAMSSIFNVHWAVSDNREEVTFLLEGLVEDDEYLSFGIPGPNMGDRMTGADVTVGRVDGAGMALADDYFLEAQAACSSGDGACPDTINSLGGLNDNFNVSGGYANGILSVRYTRSFTPSDGDFDRSFGLASQEFIFATGKLTAGGLVTYHGVDRGLKAFELGRAMAASNCQALVSRPDPPAVLGGWRRPFIANATTFVVRMGSSGGERGYSGITGEVSWGIAMYVNDIIIPVVAVERGQTYQWVVTTGSDAAVSAQYHPFYITNSSTGGYVQNTDDEKAMEKIYFGVDGSNGPNALGPFCSYQETDSSADAKLGDSYQAYFNTLSLNCIGGDADLTQFNYSWTVPMDAPDTLYYECYTHKGLGFRIRVFDQGAIDEDELARLSEPVVQTQMPTPDPIDSGAFSIRAGQLALFLCGFLSIYLI